MVNQSPKYESKATLDTIAQTLATMGETIDKRFESIDKRFDILEMKVDFIDEKVENLIVSTKKQFDDVAENMTELRNELKADIENKFNSVFR